MIKPLYLAKDERGNTFDYGNDLEVLKSVATEIVNTRELPNGLASCNPNALYIYNQARELLATVTR